MLSGSIPSRDLSTTQKILNSHLQTLTASENSLEDSKQEQIETKKESAATAEKINSMPQILNKAHENILKIANKYKSSANEQVKKSFVLSDSEREMLRSTANKILKISRALNKIQRLSQDTFKDKPQDTLTVIKQIEDNLNEVVYGLQNSVDANRLTFSSALAISASLSSTVGITLPLVANLTPFIANLASIKDILGHTNLISILQSIQISLLPVMLMQIHSDMMARFDKIETLLIDGLSITIHRLNDIRNRLSTLEKSIQLGFQQLDLKSLVATFDAIQQDIGGNFPLSDEKRSEYLAELARWIKYYVNNPIQTGLIEKNTQDLSQWVKIFNPENFDQKTMLPAVLMHINRWLPADAQKNLNLKELPNLALLESVTEGFINAITSKKYKHLQTINNYLPTLKHVQKIIEPVNTHLKYLHDNRYYFNVLFRQYDAARDVVGSVLRDCRQHIPQNAQQQQPLDSLLAENNDRHRLYAALDHMEYLRLIMHHACQLIGNPKELKNKIDQLESRDLILSRPKQFYDDNQGKNFRKLFRDGNTFELPPHGIPNSPFHLHMLLQSMAGNKEEIIKNSWWELRLKNKFWFFGEEGRFDTMTLLYAYGIDMPWDESRYSSHGRNKWNKIIEKHFLREITRDNGILHKEKLRQAYDVYISLEQGRSVFADIIKKTDPYCFLMLASMLGSIDALKAFELMAGNLKNYVNQAVPGANFTPLMMASYNGNEKLVGYLLKNGANLQEHFISVDPEIQRGWFRPDEHLTEPATLLFLALERKHQLLAAKLIVQGLKPTQAQQEQLVALQESRILDQVTLEENEIQSSALHNSDVQQVLDGIDECVATTIFALNRKDKEKIPSNPILQKKVTEPTIINFEKQFMDFLWSNPLTSSLLKSADFYFGRLVQYVVDSAYQAQQKCPNYFPKEVPKYWQKPNGIYQVRLFKPSSVKSSTDSEIALEAENDFSREMKLTKAK